MLTIKNIEKLYKQDVGDWRIGKVLTLNSSYLMELKKSNGKKMQVNLERTPIGEGDTALYELWFWADDSGHAKPIRRLLNKRDLRLGVVPLIKLIEYMMTLK